MRAGSSTRPWWSRAALEAGTDPTLIAGWTAEVNATRAAPEAQLRTANTATTRMTTNQISTLVAGIGVSVSVRGAGPVWPPAEQWRPVGPRCLRLT